ncbi:MAG: hypothetical protein EPN21_14015 [Methylococcaceae bacterium]|nr:MAG: hypothetical protein EPN21_14015 [Methylococcaceae bacterium]
MGGSNTGGGMSGGGNMGKGNMCQGVPSYKDLKAALDLAVTQDTSNLNLGMWATVVNRDGYVCAVAFSGADRNAQWPASRVISAQKANTANSLSLDGLALSTANLYSAVQGTSSVSPLGGSLYGLQFSNPVDPAVAYRGKPTDYGTAKDPMINGRIGGVNVFGGGLGLYNDKDRIIGGVGVSGDTSCRDHMVAWHIRHNLKLDNLKSVGGVAGDPKHPDNMIFSTTGSTTGWEHPDCGPGTTDPATLPAVM